MALKLARPLLYFVFVYLCWLAMLAVHEAGHVLHAWLSGGRVERMVLPLFGFSRTDLEHNPRPLFVAWGGAIWGCVIPVAIWIGATGLPGRARLTASYAQFFAGFCLIANGAYLAAGSFFDGGDAADMLRLGTPRWVLIGTGLAASALGLYFWHCLGLRTPTVVTRD
jgi:hypothetical protein